MNEIKLYSRAHVYVATVRIPIMDTPPDAILWGLDRCFIRSQRQIYVEGLLFAVAPSETVKVAEK